MGSNPPPPLFFFLLLGAPLFLLGMMTQMARMSGWTKLAARYRGRASPSDTSRRFVTGRMRRVVYRNCLRVEGSAEGLSLSVMRFVLLPFHSALLIPWSRITRRERRPGRRELHDVLTIDEVEVWLPVSVMSRFEQYLPPLGGGARVPGLAPEGRSARSSTAR